MSRTTRAGLAVAAVTTVVMASMGTASAAVPTDTSALRDAVTSDAIMDHLADLQKIADNNDGTRASGTPGYGASVDYVAEPPRGRRLRGARASPSSSTASGSCRSPSSSRWRRTP